MITRQQRSGTNSLWTVLILILGFLVLAAMTAAGVFLLVQRQTGARAQATVDDCVASGAGRYRTVHCTGTWIVGGSLLEGGHVIVGTIDGVDEDAVGKTIDVTLRGGTAYSRDLTLPLLLIGLGLVPGAVMVYGICVARRPPPGTKVVVPFRF